MGRSGLWPLDIFFAHGPCMFYYTDLRDYCFQGSVEKSPSANPTAKAASNGKRIGPTANALPNGKRTLNLKVYEKDLYVNVFQLISLFYRLTRRLPLK